MKKIFRKIFVVITFLIFTYSLNIYASTEQSYGTTSTTDNSTTSILTPSKYSQYKSYDYVIDKYNINIIVNENNTLDITEDITAYFNISKHGIIRTIPLRNNITRLDGTTSTNRTQITNLSVNSEYATSREDGNLKIKIGSESRTLTGEQKYTIKYTYNLGKDPSKNYDELYYNIIGNEWDTVIGNVTFSITMPKTFDTKKVGFSSGEKGSTSNNNIRYSISGNTISGGSNRILQSGEGLTIRCELPEGYFVGAGLSVNILSYIIYIIPVIFLTISIWLWHKFGRDDQVMETVEFYPPKGFNSLEIGFLYKGKAESQDVTSLLIYLANQGYVKISETEGKKGLFSKSSGFKITKLKEYDGNNINEKIFLDGLFKKKNVFTPFVGKQQTSIENVNEVTADDLYDNFYVTQKEILSNINSSENIDAIFEKTASNKAALILLMIIAAFCLITIPPLYFYGKLSNIVYALLMPGFGFTFLFIMLFGKPQTIYINGRPTNSAAVSKMFGLVWGGIFGGLPWALTLLPALKQDSIYFIGYFIGLLCVAGMSICFAYSSKRTPYGNEMLGKLRGFKNYLETAEKDTLEALVMQNPTYFYDILPYTYVLGVSDIWISKFETISMQAPRWYDGNSDFNMIAFGSFMDSAMSSAQSSMSYDSSSDSSSGGGSSGGGSGGGGGSSW